MGNAEKQILELKRKLQEEIELRKKAEEEYKRGRKKFSHLVELMNEGLVMQDLDQNILYANQHFLKLLNLPRSKVVGFPLSSFVEADYVDAWTKQINAELTEPYICKMLRKGNEPFWVKASPQPLVDVDKTVIGTFAVVTDIDDQVRAEEELVKSEIKLRSLAKQVLSAQEVERKRIASELHDGIGQTLSAIKFYVENNIKEMKEAFFPEAEKFEKIIPKMQSAIEEVRRISMALRPSLLDDIGILATFTWFCRESNMITPNVDFSFRNLNLKESDIDAHLKTEMFRIVQEAVNNATKYSGAKHVEISLSVINQMLCLEVSDDGVGFDYDKIVKLQGFRESKGMGLVSIRERVENSNGRFTIKTDPINGTKVICEWPHEELSVFDKRTGKGDRRKSQRLSNDS